MKTFTLLLSTLLAATCAAPARLASQTPAAPSFRVLVIGKQGAADLAGLSASTAQQLGRVLQGEGMPVVDADQAKRLAARSAGVVQTWLGGEAGGRDAVGAQAALAYADVLVEVEVTGSSQRKRQGRYVVEDRATWRAVFVDGAETIGSGEARGSGRSFDGFGAAHETAVREMLDPGQEGSIAGGVVKALREARADEVENGALITVGFYVENRFLELAESLRAALQSAEGVVDGSVQHLRRYPSAPFVDGTQGTAQEYRLRYRGGLLGLQDALLSSLDTKAEAIEKEHGLVPSPVFLASGRRVDLVVRFHEAEGALADEVARVVREAVDLLWMRNRAGLEGKRIDVLPASIALADGASRDLHAFRRLFWEMIESAERRLADEGRPDADPLDVEMSVEFGGQTWDDLRAAQAHLFELEAAFYESREGQLALEIARQVARDLLESSEGAVTVQPTSRERDRALDLIKLEAAAYSADAAIDPETIAFYEQQGSQVFVATRLRKYFDRYVVTVEAVDLDDGTGYQGASYFHERFTEALRAELGG